MKKNKKAFTLIELIAVLVILALIALIVMPLVMNIVKKAKDSANKRSVDAYGKALEIGVASYLLEQKEYPTSLLGLKVEYSGNEAVCKIKKLNEDGSIYLSECSVAGMEVKDSKEEDGYYHYGKNVDIESKPIAYQVYNVGDIVKYNGMNFYVIENSDETKDSVTLLKAEPLTVDEVNKYGVGHVNRYVASSAGIAHNSNGYGGMQYYSSETCGCIGSEWLYTGCVVEYSESEVKYAVDAWASDKLNELDLKVDNQGYKTRLLSFEDLINNLGYVYEDRSDDIMFNSEKTSNWVYNSNYSYWTMSTSKNSTSQVWHVGSSGSVSKNLMYSINVVRPVITLSKSAI